MRAFSLIELMVVIAIVAILAAAAVPVYKDYLLKAKIINAISLTDSFQTDVLKTYAIDGEIPVGPTFAGNTWPQTAVSWHVADVGAGIMMLGYFTYANGAVIASYLDNLDGIPGYVAPVNPGSMGTNSQFAVAFYDDGSGVIEVACGAYATWGSSIPTEYMPAGCTCASIESFVTNGTGC